jgi:ATP-dependent protease ClpP protease subunit
MPITVFIDSPGGPVNSMERLLRLLRLSDQDRSGPCRVITVVAANAGSAAADLLSSGDYALSYPSSNILYHGVRTFDDNPLTMEYASRLANSLREGNDLYAMQLARKIEDRFTFRFLFARTEFDELRKQKNTLELSDLDCFIEIISSKLSREAQKVWGKAKERYGRYEDLLGTVLNGKAFSQNSKKKTLADLEGHFLKALISFEVKTYRKNPDWSFSNGGLSRLVDDFFLFSEYIDNYGSERLKNWCASFGRWLIPEEKLKNIEAIKDETERDSQLLETVRPILQPIWSFFVALCHALQEGENRLTAKDAYWLGLIDEVIGENLMSGRLFEEFEPDAESPKT